MTRARWIRMIGVWQMVGGGVATVVFLDAVRNVPAGQWVATMLVIVGAIVALGTAIAGYGLYRGRRAALVPSLVAQGLQLVGFNMGTAIYQLTLGPYLYLSIVWGARVSFNAGFMPEFRFRFGASPTGEASAAAVNVLACWCFWRLIWTEPHELRDHGASVTTTVVESRATTVGGPGAPAA